MDIFFYVFKKLRRFIGKTHNNGTTPKRNCHSVHHQCSDGCIDSIDCNFLQLYHNPIQVVPMVIGVMPELPCA